MQNSVEKALYLTEQKYKAISSKYHCYAMSIGTATEYQWGPSFMNYLANGNKVDFSRIENDILYLVDEGSTIVDHMGYVEATTTLILKIWKA